jgi:hypothetical protein
MTSAGKLDAGDHGYRMMAARKLHAARLTDCGKGHHEFWMAVSRIVDDQQSRILDEQGRAVARWS